MTISDNRKAMIFAAGLGTRLKPLTDNMPKALLCVAGKPILEHLIIKLKQSGYTQIVINVHHFADMIIDFLNKNNHFGIDIFISDERDRLLDTGGGIKNAARFLQGDKPFLVHNVDIISNVDLNEMYERHIEKDSLSTLLVNNRESTRCLFFNVNDRLCGWQNKSTGELKWCNANFSPDDCKAYAFGGIHVMSPKIFQYFTGWNGKFSIIDFYLSIAQTRNIAAYIPQQLQIIDIGKKETLQQAEREFYRITSFVNIKNYHLHQ
jgi:NDP-sugar pyrophosphorylase family protein